MDKGIKIFLVEKQNKVRKHTLKQNYALYLKKVNAKKEVHVILPTVRNSCGGYLISEKLDFVFHSRMVNVLKPLKIVSMLTDREN